MEGLDLKGTERFCSIWPSDRIYIWKPNARLICHFRVPKTLTLKMRLGAQPFLWKWVLFAWEWKMISISKAEHLPSFWNRGPWELGNDLLYSSPYIDETCFIACKQALHLRKDWREDSVIYPKRNCSVCSENGWIRKSDYQKRVFFVIWLLSTIKRLKHWNFVQSSTI